MSKAKMSKKVLEQEAKRQRGIVKDVLYKWLLEHTKSIEEAKTFCKVASMLVKEKFSFKIDSKLKETQTEERKRLSLCKLSELEIDKDNKKDKNLKEILPIIELFKEETVATADNLIGGMANALESFEKKEMNARKLETLETDFLS